MLRDFQVFAKPTGAACNLACRYCYYLDAAAPGGSESPPRMPDDVLEAYIAQHIEVTPGPEIVFSWHGGEPTLLGVGFFQRVVEIQRRYRRDSRRIVNGIQTNGLLIDADWCRFLAAEGFRVGVSIDGPADLHDRYRLTRGGGPSHARAVRAFELLLRHDVPCDVLCVVHDRNVREPTRVYRFFRRLGARSVGFLPLVEARPDAPGAVSPESVPAETYGVFLCAIFDEWVERDSARIAVQLFDEATRPARGLPHSLCIFREVCGDVPVVETDGSFYSCDHFVDSDHRLGNVRREGLLALLEHPAQRAFGEAKRDSLPSTCRTCDVLPMCNGGCPKDRFVRTPDGEPGLNYLCPGFKRFFTHVLPYAVRTGLERRGDQSLSWLAEPNPVRGGLARAEPARGASPPAAGRNDPCPCGSGKKFKKCCGAG